MKNPKESVTFTILLIYLLEKKKYMHVDYLPFEGGRLDLQSPPSREMIMSMGSLMRGTIYAHALPAWFTVVPSAGLGFTCTDPDESQSDLSWWLGANHICHIRPSSVKSWLT